MRKSWPSLNLKFIVSEKSGKKEELGSYVCWSTKLQAMLEYWWELTKRTNVSWITMSSKKTSSVNWSSLKQVIIAGLGLPKIFLTRSLKLKSFVRNSLLNKNTSVLKWSSTRLPKSIILFPFIFLSDFILLLSRIPCNDNNPTLPTASL